ncbi:MAG: hypothetical protein JW728_05645 [Candidatus Aureabacteria bacterium]|nr:hypothetical protein [Candidatus Auribacterota bacterium]
MKVIAVLACFVLLALAFTDCSAEERVIRRTYTSGGPFYESEEIVTTEYSPATRTTRTTVIERPGETVVIYPSRRVIVNPNRGYLYQTDRYSTSTITQETVEIVE